MKPSCGEQGVSDFILLGKGIFSAALSRRPALARAPLHAISISIFKSWMVIHKDSDDCTPTKRSGEPAAAATLNLAEKLARPVMRKTPLHALWRQLAAWLYRVPWVMHATGFNTEKGDVSARTSYLPHAGDALNIGMYRYEKEFSLLMMNLIAAGDLLALKNRIFLLYAGPAETLRSWYLSQPTAARLKISRWQCNWRISSGM